MINNKKAQIMDAPTWLIAIFIYFIFFLLIVYSSEQIQDVTTTDLVTVDLGAFEFNSFIGGSYCNNPRYSYNPQTGEQTEYNTAENDRLFCEESIGALSQSTCNDINGCNWENVTSGWWLWESSSYGCFGDINASSYGIDQSYPTFGRTRIASHNNSNFWQTYTPFADPSACTHPQVFQNKTMCDMFSCTWETITPETNFNSAGNLYNSIKDVFTFRYDFGFSNNVISFIMNIIFIVLPLIILILSVYYIFHPVK